MPEFSDSTSIFHHTNLDGAIKILQNGTLRATHAEFMNDKRELSFQQQLWGRLGDLIERDGENFDPDNGWMEAVWSSESAIGAHEDTLWVTCFSTLEDDLGMWRGYGDEGIAIEFDGEMLKAVMAPAYVAPIIYADQPLSDADFANVENLARQWRRERGRPGADPGLAGLVSLVKERKWQAESEVRFVWHEHTHVEAFTDSFDNMGFTPGKYGIRPHIDREFGRVGAWSNGIVKSVWIGPGRFQDENFKAMKLLILKHMYDLSARLRDSGDGDFVWESRPEAGEGPFEVEVKRSAITMR